MLTFLAHHQLLTLMLVLALGALFGQIKFGPLRFGAAGALFVGLIVGALNSDFGQGLSLVKALGIVLFCYTVGLTAGGTFVSDLRRQWKLMAAGVVGLAVMAAATLGAGRLLGLSPAAGAGLYAGVLTSPAIDAATSATGNHPDTLVGYAIAYPTGVLVGMIIVALVAKRRWAAPHDNRSLAEAGIVATTATVDRAIAIGAVPGWADEAIKMSYLQRGQEIRVVSPSEELHPGDRVLVVGNPDDVAQAVGAIGHESSHDLTHQRRDVDFRRFLVSNPAIAGRTISELNLEGRMRGIVTRVRRGDLDMLAKDSLRLQPGDRVLAVVPREHMGEASQFFGDSEQRVFQVDALTLGLGVALGLLAGSVAVPLPGGLRFELGPAAGPLVVGMILGALHRTGPFRWDLPHAVNATLRQLGLMIFLACIGLATGPAFLHQGFSRAGLAIVATSALSLALGGALLLVAARIFGLSAQRATGAFAGFVGQPAILSFANRLVNDERIESAYGALFALGTIAKILLVQLIAMG